MMVSASTVQECLDRLAQLARELEQRGDTRIAMLIDREVDTIRAETARSKLMTPEEAAQALGLPSGITIKHWARRGHLEGYRQDGRILVSARSVAAMSESPLLAKELEAERRFDAAFAPFDFDHMAPDEFEFGMTWEGRKPWQSCDTTES